MRPSLTRLGPSLKDTTVQSEPGVGLRQRIRYRFDNLLARGTWAVLLWLGAVTLLAVIISSALLALFQVTLSGSADKSWLEDAWQSLLRILDTGTMAADAGWGRRILALLVTIFGVLVAGTLIGLIANGIEERVEAMRRGRSAVLEQDHVVILGASERLPAVVEELAVASGSQRSCVVVLADRPPTEVSEDLHARAVDLGQLRLVFRFGDPDRRSDLAMVRIENARAVIVLAQEGRGDAGVMKAVMAVGAQLGTFDSVPIVAEIDDPSLAEQLVRVSGSAVHPFAVVQSLARITALGLYRPGLHHVVGDLVDLTGAGIHVWTVGDLAGHTFGEAVFRFARGRPIGRIASDGALELAPTGDTRLEREDRLVMVSHREPPEVDWGGSGRLERDSSAGASSPERREEHLLIVGLNPLAGQLLAELDAFAAPGSTATVVYDETLVAADGVQLPVLERLSVELTPARAPVVRVGDGSWTEQITAIVLLGYRDVISTDEADARTLLNLMSIRREILAASDRTDWLPPRLIVELLEAESRDLAPGLGPDDYVVTDAIASRIAVQLAGLPERRAVLLGLYAPAAPSIDLIEPAELQLSGEVTFGDVVVAAASSGLLAIGWRVGGKTDRIVELDPHVSTHHRLEPSDRIVVIG